MIINNKATKDESLKFHNNFSLLTAGDKVEGKISHAIKYLIPFTSGSEVTISNLLGSKNLKLNIPIPLKFSKSEIDDTDFVEIISGEVIIIWSDVLCDIENIGGFAFNSDNSSTPSEDSPIPTEIPISIVTKDYSEGTQLVSNENFENGLTDWVIFAGTGVVNGTTNKFITTSSSVILRQSNVYPIGNSRFRIESSIEASGGDTTYTIYLGIGGDTVTGVIPDGQEEIISIDVDSNVTESTLQIQLSNPTGQSLVSYFTINELIDLNSDSIEKASVVKFFEGKTEDVASRIYYKNGSVIPEPDMFYEGEIDNMISTIQEVLNTTSKTYNAFSKISGVVLTGTVDVTIDSDTITYPFTDVSGNSITTFSYGNECTKNNSVIQVDASSGSCNVIIDK